MTDTIRHIDITPNWATAATIYATTLECGTPEGQAMARAEIIKLGELIDDLQAELKRLQATEVSK